jgi:hypothetical protein
MKRIALYLLLRLPLCLALSPSAWASWGSFISTGTGTGVGVPSCAHVSTDHVVCAVRSGKAAMMVNEFNGTAWKTSWTSLVGTVSSDPSCTSDGAGKVICAAASSGNLLWSIFNGTTWSAPATASAALYSAPSCAQYTTGKVLCAARSLSGGLTWSVYNGTSWKAFANLASSTESAPSCTTDNNDGVICGVFTTASVTLVNRYAGGTWKGFLNLSGSATSVPDCTSMNSAGNVVCFAEGIGNGIYGTRFNGVAWMLSSWSLYGEIGGASAIANTSCTSQSPGLLLCGVLGTTDNALWSNLYDGSIWSGWSKVGGLGINSPVCAPLGTGQVVCVVLGINNKLRSVVGP